MASGIAGSAGATGWAALFGVVSYAAIGLGVPGNPTSWYGSWASTA